MPETDVRLLFHFPGKIVRLHEGAASSDEGIPRVMRRLVHAILKTTAYTVTVTCTRENLAATRGFFSFPEPGLEGRVRFQVFARGWTPEGSGLAARALRRLSGYARTPARVRCMARINADPSVRMVIVPHYHHFPEAVLLRKPLWLYVPDFIPHFFPRDFANWRGNRNTWVGRVLARKARRVLTNSRFTRDYLPKTALRIPAEKIHVLPLPLLTPGDAGAPAAATAAAAPYLFYPTQNRPQKNLGFAFSVLKELRERFPALRLVLTCRINDYAPAARALDDLGLQDAVDFRPGLDDRGLHALYRGAAALLFTSSFEGNFPPQVFEALSAGTPVVASDIPMIRESLEEYASALALCPPLDLAVFVEKTGAALNDPDAARLRQAPALAALTAKAGDRPFLEAVGSLYANA